MDLRTTARRLRLTEEQVAAIKPGWAASQRWRSKQGVAFLTPEFVADACAEVTISQDLIALAVAAAKRVSDNEAAASFASYCHLQIYGPGGYSFDTVRR